MAKQKKKQASLPKQIHDVFTTFDIKGKTWTILTTACTLGGDPKRGGGVYGYCDLEKNQIIIDGTLNSAKFLEILFHEVSHAIDPKESEAKVLLRGRVYCDALIAVTEKKLKHRKK